MKLITRLTLAALLTTAVFGTALADTDFGALRHDPMAAIEAGDVLGLEVIPRSELEEVRGEDWQLITGLAAEGFCLAIGSPACGTAVVFSAYYLRLMKRKTSFSFYPGSGTTPCAYVDGRYIYCK
jgi:hypothetical protein